MFVWFRSISESKREAFSAAMGGDGTDGNRLVAGTRT